MLAQEVGAALARLGNERVLHVQQIAALHNIPASVLLSLGLRETGLTNEEGGATWNGQKWVASYTDTGVFQISRQFPEQLAWLKSVPGCPSGTWTPAPGHTPAEKGYCPRFADSCLYVVKEFAAALSYAADAGVAPAQRMRFAVAAHNAGLGGALEGYRSGNVDEHTAHGDYSKDVMANSGLVHDWVVAHPNWVWSSTKGTT